MSGAGAFSLTRDCLKGRTAKFQKAFDSWFYRHAISSARPTLREVIR